MAERTSTPSESERQAINTPAAKLEQALIETFLATKGYTLAEVEALPPALAKHLLAEASQFASLKLTEIESAAHLWANVEGKEQSHFTALPPAST